MKKDHACENKPAAGSCGAEAAMSLARNASCSFPDARTGENGGMPDFATCRVRDLAMADPRYHEALEKLGIDCCCGGGRKLKEAAAAAGVDFAQIRRALERAGMSPRNVDEIDWRSKPVTELADYLLNVHHAALHEDLPQLSVWFSRVEKAHGGEHPELHRLRAVFEAFRSALEEHLKLEEVRLFPHIGHVEEISGLAELIAQLESEHTDAGDELRTLSQLTDGYRLPPYACMTTEMLFKTLKKTDEMLHEHIFLENNILFVKLES